MKKKYIRPQACAMTLWENTGILAASNKNPNIKVGVDDWDSEDIDVSNAKRFDTDWEEVRQTFSLSNGFEEDVH